MERRYYCLLYWNSNGLAGAVVAVVNLRDNGEVFDWCAYIGSSRETWQDRLFVEEVSRHGDKLDSDLACFMAEQRGLDDILTAHNYRY